MPVKIMMKRTGFMLFKIVTTLMRERAMSTTVSSAAAAKEGSVLQAKTVTM